MVELKYTHLGWGGREGTPAVVMGGGGGRYEKREENSEKNVRE
jgi:hypothetical protein